jgi:hypothetical protein
MSNGVFCYHKMIESLLSFPSQSLLRPITDITTLNPYIILRVFPNFLLFLVWKGNFSLLWSVQTNSGAQSAFYANGTVLGRKGLGH